MDEVIVVDQNDELLAISYLFYLDIVLLSLTVVKYNRIHTWDSFVLQNKGRTGIIPVFPQHTNLKESHGFPI